MRIFNFLGLPPFCPSSISEHLCISAPASKLLGLIIIMTTCATCEIECAICLDECESEKTLGFDNCSHRCICLSCAHQVLERTSFIVTTEHHGRYHIAKNSGIVRCPLCRKLSNASVGGSLVMSKRERNKCIRFIAFDNLLMSCKTLRSWKQCGVQPRILSVSSMVDQ